MHIGIDARLWAETGVGRYIRALVTHLVELDEQNTYTLFLRQKEYTEVQVPSHWHKVLAEVKWHTVAEQFQMPRLYRQARLDLLHIPYFSVPVFTPAPFLVTIHDITISHFATGKATTLPLPLYNLKRLGYQLVLKNAIKRATKIITVSETVKRELITDYHLNTNKIVVIYESGELEAVTPTGSTTPNEYLLYVGNAHPHKNLERLIQAFVVLREQFPQLKLVFVGKLDFFYMRLKRLVIEKNLVPYVIFTDQIPSGQLVKWYTNAKLLVFPSLAEGFGIPGLEAMSLGCPVIASDISVFREIYKEAALYFDPRNVAEIATVVGQVLTNPAVRQKLIMNGKAVHTQYSWRKMAQETLTAYENCHSL